MERDAQVLTLAQWFSPGYPIGAFAYSHGLECAIADGRIATARALRGWLADVIAHGSGRNDAILLRSAHGAATAAALREIDRTARALAPSRERLEETCRQGAAFGKVTAAIGGRGCDGLTYPVAAGDAARRAGLDPALTAAMFLHAFAANLVSAALRAMPLGQTDGQKVLASLAPLCLDIATRTAGAGLDDLHSSAFLSDIAAMAHETQAPRIFCT